MIAIERLHHVGIPAHDFAVMRDFYTRLLGLEAHPEKSNWLRAGDSFSVHLMPAVTAPGSQRLDQHFALQVASLRDLVVHLLGQGFAPFQASLQGELHRITGPDDPLDFGIGTVFLTDPENNTVEFLQAGKGIYATLAHGNAKRPETPRPLD